MQAVTRRNALAGIAAATLASATPLRKPLANTINEAGLELADPQPFSFNILKRRAEALSKSPWRSPRSPYADILDKIDYTAFFKIVFRTDHSLWLKSGSGLPIQLFHLGRYCNEPCSVSVVENGQAREIVYRQDYFDMPADHVARQLPHDVGFAGFRAMGGDQTWDWLSFLGASYFRSPGSGRQYGLSARGLAVDSGLSPEEFPRFIAFWLEGAPDASDRFVAYALLDGPSVVGAYRFDCARRGGVVMDTELTLYPRKPIQRLGIAPLTSMFWYSEKDRARAIDWRPEIHDSDGLALWTGKGERIWRPLNNPPQVMTNSFGDENPRGFGFLQRDRHFSHYQDDAVFYDRRPSLWVEPTTPWGRGSVQLVEIPTVDEIHDNVVAFWAPEEPVGPGRKLDFSYRLHWGDDEPFRSPAARVADVFEGVGGNPGENAPRPRDERRFVVDFVGGRLGEFEPTDPVRAVASSSRGRILRSDAFPVMGKGQRFRAVLDVKASGPEPVDLRLFLKIGDEALTETCILQHFPEDPRGRVVTLSTQ
jgi:glucans biosynthesis protein